MKDADGGGDDDDDDDEHGVLSRRRSSNISLPVDMTVILLFFANQKFISSPQATPLSTTLSDESNATTTLTMSEWRFLQTAVRAQTFKAGSEIVQVGTMLC